MSNQPELFAYNVNLYASVYVNPYERDIIAKNAESGSVDANVKVNIPLAGTSSANALATDTGDLEVKATSEGATVTRHAGASTAFSFHFTVPEELEDVPLNWNFDLEGKLEAEAPLVKGLTLADTDVYYGSHLVSDAGSVLQEGTQRLIVINGIPEIYSNGIFENSEDLRAKIKPTIEFDSDIDDGLVDNAIEYLTGLFLNKIDCDINVKDLSATTGIALSILAGVIPSLELGPDFFEVELGLSVSFYSEYNKQFSMTSVGSGLFSHGLTAGSRTFGTSESADSAWKLNGSIPTITVPRDFEGEIAEQQVTLDNESAQRVFFEANGEIVVGSNLGDELEGSELDDILRGLEAGDILSGLAGDDALEGGLGDDTLNGNEGMDTLYGDEGNDSLLGGNDDDLILTGDGLNFAFGQSGNDTIVGGSDRDKIYGGGGQDLIEGDRGDDLIQGGSGQDTLTGGAGIDTYVYRVGDGQDLIQDAGNDDGDRIFFDTSIEVENTIFTVSTENSADLLISFGTSDNSILVSGQFADDTVNRIETFNFDNNVIYSHEDISTLTV